MAAIGLCCAAQAGEAPMEWTFQEALRQWAPMTKPIQHIGVPGCQWQVAVCWDGSMVVGQNLHRRHYVHPRLMDEVKAADLGDNLLKLSVAFGDKMRFADRLGTGSLDIRRGLVDGQYPLPWIETRDGDLVWQETVYAHILGRRFEDGMKPLPDDKLFVQVRFRAKNAGRASRVAHLWLHFGDQSQTTVNLQPNAPPAEALNFRWQAPCGLIGDKVRYALPQPKEGELVWHDEVVAADGSGTWRRVMEWRVPVKAGADAELRLVLPYGLWDRSVANRAMAQDWSAGFAEAKRFWKQRQSGGARIVTPDPLINDYLVALVGQMAEQVCLRHRAKLWMYKVSPNVYEDYYAGCAAMGLPTFDLCGLTDLAAPVLSCFASFQSDDPTALMVNRQTSSAGLGGEGFEKRFGMLGDFGLPTSAVPLGDPKQGWSANTTLSGHGQMLYALATHYRLTRDDRWLRRGKRPILEAIVAACDWITAQRRRTKREVGGERVPYWGLLPPASAHDWLSGSTVFNDAWCIFGIAEAVRLLREVGDPRAETVARDLADYRKCLKERYEEATAKATPMPLPDGSSLQYVPRMVTELDWSKPDWTYTSYGPLRAAGLGALDPNGRLADLALAYLEAGRPVEGGRQYLWPHKVEPETHWPMYRVFLERDDLPRFFELAFNNLAAAVHWDFRVGCEARDGVPSCAPADAERYRMIRSMFVDEVGGGDGSPQSLFLLQAIPRSWLRPGAHLSVENMRTAFGGKVDLAVEVAADGESVRVSLRSANLAADPAGVLVRLRSGDGRPLASAEVDGKAVPVEGGDVIHLPVARNGRWRIVGRFGKPG